VPRPFIAWPIAAPGLGGVVLGGILLVAALRRLGHGSGRTALPFAAGIMLLLAGAGLIVRAVS
jgi:hypothetical protein